MNKSISEKNDLIAHWRPWATSLKRALENTGKPQSSEHDGLKVFYRKTPDGMYQLILSRYLKQPTILERVVLRDIFDVPGVVDPDIDYTKKSWGYVKYTWAELKQGSLLDKAETSNG